MEIHVHREPKGTRRLPTATAGLLGALLLVATGTGRAEPQALSWVRLPGAESCVQTLELARLVEERVGHPVFEAPSRAEISIEGHVRQAEGAKGPGAPRWQARIVIRDGAGQSLGERELSTRDPDCRSLDLPAALVIALALDGDAALPGLLEGETLSDDANTLLENMSLPAGDADQVLALIPTRVSAPVEPPSASAKTPAVADPGANEQEERPAPTARKVTRPQDVERSAQPAWPGYAFLGLGAASAGLMVYSFLRVDDIAEDPRYGAYSAAAYNDENRPGDICSAAAQNRTFGLSSAEPAYVDGLCDEADALDVIGTLAFTATLTSLAVGVVWLVWVADDDANAAHADHAMLVPSLSQHEASLTLHGRF